MDREPTAADVEMARSRHRLIQRVTDEYERWSYNTAVSSFMQFTNELYAYTQSADGARRETLDEAIDTVLLLMAPMAPHISAELWERRNGTHVHTQPWPVADADMTTVATATMIVQVNGKVRDRIDVDAAITEDDAVATALASEKVQAHLNGGEPKKVIARPPTWSTSSSDGSGCDTRCLIARSATRTRVSRPSGLPRPGARWRGRTRRGRRS